MENRWIKAATILSPTIEVCGKRLLPFCLRHRVALEAIGSPLLQTDKPMTADQLLATVRILSTHNIEDIRKPTTIRECLLSAKLSRNKRALIKECYNLSLYMEGQSLWPRFWTKEDSGKTESSIPWPLTIVASLMRNGCTYEQAWTMPESEAIWLHIAHCSADGAGIQVVSDVEWEAMEAHKRQQAEKAEQTNKQAQANQL